MAKGLPIVKTESGWFLDFRPAGRYGPRVRRIFDRKRDAENFYFSEVAKARSGSYQKSVNDNRRLEQLITDWYTLHGCTLKDGQKRLQKLYAIARRLGNPVAKLITPSVWVEYRNQRLVEKKSNGMFISRNNINHEQAYLAAVFSKLRQLKNWQYGNPLEGIEKLKIDQRQLFFLQSTQIRALLSAAKHSSSQDLYDRIRLCLATGARWGEVQKLTANNFRGGVVYFEATKNSRARAVPISDNLRNDVLKGRPTFGPLFYGNLRYAFEGAIIQAKIELPPGQATHVLRHTFASHHIINGGGIKELQELLGHQSLNMTMRYAHLAQDSLKQCLTTNPLANI